MTGTPTGRAGSWPASGPSASRSRCAWTPAARRSSCAARSTASTWRGRSLWCATSRPAARIRIGRAAGPDPVRDGQIAIYGLVARELAARWGVPGRVATAYTYVGRGAEERSWRDDFDRLLAPAARKWLGVAGGLLAERGFPRTPNSDDCAYCRFRPVCGEDAPARADEVLRDATGMLARFRDLKTPEEGDQGA